MQDMAASNAGSAPTCQPIPGALQEPQGPSIIAPSGRLALTPHTNPQQKGVQISAKGQTSTPRSREEIRRLFTKRPALPHSATLQPTLAHSSHAYVQQPTSRLQHQVSSVPAQCQPIPISGPLPGSRIRTDAQHAGATHPHSNPGHVQHQALTGPADFQAPPSFRQFACPSSSLSAPASGQRSSGHSSHEHHALQRNSLPVQRASSASTGTCTEGKPPSGPTATSSGTGPSLHSGGGPMLRAEILMGPAATIEVNVRFHANIAAALKK